MSALSYKEVCLGLSVPRDTRINLKVITKKCPTFLYNAAGNALVSRSAMSGCRILVLRNKYTVLVRKVTIDIRRSC